MFSCSDCAPYFYSEAGTYISIMLLSEKGRKVDLLLSILLNCQKSFILGILTVAMAKEAKKPESLVRIWGVFYSLLTGK